MKKTNTQPEMPHNGKLLYAIIQESSLNISQAAQHLGVSPGTMTRYWNNDALTTDVLWKASQIFDINIFAYLAEKLPVTYESEQQREQYKLENEQLNEQLKKHEQQLQMQQREIELQRREIETLTRALEIVNKKK